MVVVAKLLNRMYKFQMITKAKQSKKKNETKQKKETTTRIHRSGLLKT